MVERINSIEILYLRPDAIYAFEDEEIKRVLKRYIEIVNNRAFARFFLLKSLEVEIPKDANLDELLRLHDELIKEVRKNESKKLKFYKTNLLTLKKIIANEIVKECQFCEWKCKVDRSKEQKGFCRVGKRNQNFFRIHSHGRRKFYYPFSHDLLLVL